MPDEIRGLRDGRGRALEKLVVLPFEANGTKKDVILKNEPERLLKAKDRGTKTNRNEPENEAEKLLKTHSCGKNEPKNEPEHVVENKGWLEIKPKTKRWSDASM